MLPEELVRQKLVHLLIHELKYPKSLISTEKSLNTLSIKKSSDRRVDVLCYRKLGESLAPYLLIECKARKPTDQALHQLIGYNAFIGAPFIALIWNDGGLCLERIDKTWQTRAKLPSYPDV